MGNLPTHIYWYNNEHYVIVYTVVKDTQSECGQPCHRFQKNLSFGPFTLKDNPGVFKLKRGLRRFRKSQFSRVENTGVV